MKNKQQLDIHMHNSFHEADAIPPTSTRPTLEPDAYPGNPYSVRNMSSLAHDPIQPQFESELPTHQDLGFTDQLEMELWLDLEITPPLPATPPPPAKDERPGDLAPQAQEMLDEQLHNEDIGEKIYPEVFMDQSNINSHRSRDLTLQAQGLADDQLWQEEQWEDGEQEPNS